MKSKNKILIDINDENDIITYRDNYKSMRYQYDFIFYISDKTFYYIVPIKCFLQIEKIRNLMNEDMNFYILNNFPITLHYT